MGCFPSKPAATVEKPRPSKSAAAREETWDGVLRPLEPWQHEPAVTKEQVLRMRSEFWDTQPHYGGSREIWNALKASIEMDEETRMVILSSADIIVGKPYDMTVCYDSRGFKYELPNYLIAFPTNLLPDGAPAPLTPQQLAIKQLAAQRLLPTNGDPARAAAVYV